MILGVLDEAVAVAREQVREQADQLRAYEQVEWSRAEAGPLARGAGVRRRAPRRSRAVNRRSRSTARLRAKEAVADLAEQTLLRLTRVLGGGTFSQRSPFAHWFEDVRALGFLRPPWGLAYDTLFASSIE